MLDPPFECWIHRPQMRYRGFKSRSSIQKRDWKIWVLLVDRQDTHDTVDLVGDVPLDLLREVTLARDDVAAALLQDRDVSTGVNLAWPAATSTLCTSARRPLRRTGCPLSDQPLTARPPRSSMTSPLAAL